MKPPGAEPSASCRGTMRLLAVLAVAAIALHCRPQDQAPRAIEARLSSQVSFSPCRSLSPPVAELEPSPCGSPPSGEERSRLLPLAREPGAAPRSLAAAVRLSEDAEALTRTLQRFESRSAGWTRAERELALGALQHALAKASGDAAHLISAFEHTEAALAADPSSLPGRFNRALIASDLGLCRLAEAAWLQYLEADPASDWGEEAADRLALLTCTESQAADTASADDLFKSATEPLLRGWIEARLKGSRAAEPFLEKIRQAGEELHLRSGEPMIRELARELAAASTPAQLAAIQDHVDLRARFEKETGLKAPLATTPLLPDPFRWLGAWNDIWLAGVDIYHGRIEAAESRLAPLLRSPELARSPHLQGRLFWTLGWAAMRAGRLQTAYDRFLRAEKEFQRGKYRTSAAAVRILRVETMSHLGFVREAWTPRILTLRALQAVRGSFSFSHAGLLDGASFAERAGAHAVADAFLEEAARLARSQGNLNSEIEVLLAKARALRQRGAHAEASEKFSLALETAQSLESGPVRERFEKIAVVGLWADPAYTGRTREAELRAAAGFLATQAYFLQLQALRVQAAGERREGASAAARQTFDDTIAVIHHLQNDIDGDEAGVRQLDLVQDFFDEAIEAAVTEDQPLRALDLLEAARRGAAPGQEAREVSRDLRLEVRTGSRLPDGDPVIVVLGMTPEIFVWWRVEGRAVGWGWSAAAPVAEAVQAVLDTAPSGRTGPGQLERLYDVLLAAALRGAPPGHPLVLVPDGPLQRVPFSALRNRGTGVRLIEERAVSLRTSFRAAREPAAGERTLKRSQWRAIAVGDPAFDVKQLPLTRLPGAVREAEEVAAIYGDRARLLTGEAASAEAVSRAAAAGEVLHLAVHATLGEDGFRDALVLAADPDGKTSGLATADEVLPPDASLQLVVLSGCSTLGVQPSRSGGLLGLARSFVARGIPATLGTLWPVDDRELPGLMAAFHRFLLQGLSASEALRQAQLAYLAENPNSCCGWAALQLIGDVPANP